MTSSTEKANFFQICSGFLFPFSKGSRSGSAVNPQETSAELEKSEIFLGEVSKKERKKILSLWQKFITCNDAFAVKANTSISTFLSENLNLLPADCLEKAVITAYLKLDNQPDKIVEAMKNSVKIFHEDHPGSYILTYNKKRLGMFIISLCKKENDNYMISYKFNPTITSFN